MTDYFTTGFMGTSSAHVLEAATEYVVGDRLLLPMTGSGKDVAHLSAEGVFIRSFDTQYISHLFVNGVFNWTEGPSLQKASKARGWAIEHHPVYKRMHEEVSEVIDGMALEGNDFDRACLVPSIIQSTVAGRLTHWDASSVQFVRKFLRRQEAWKEWSNIPGTREHSWGSVFDYITELEEQEWDTIWIDPPKVVSSTDVYSKQFVDLNSMVAQKTTPLPTWRKGDVVPRHKELWELPAKRIIQFYCTGVRPHDLKFEEALTEYGDLAERIEVPHGSKTDIIYILDK